jgi:hypothetical protein
MIERWLQITCDSCGETDNSTAPNMTIVEFMSDLSRTFVRRGSMHLCTQCVAAESKRAAKAKRKGRP